MNILILSDSHGHRALVREAVDRVRPDALLFAGDGLRDLAAVDDLPCPLYAVCGNCDLAPPPLPCVNASAAGEMEEESLFELDGIRILLMHGHRLGVKNGYMPAILHAAKVGADVLIFGHTHEPMEKCLRPDDGGFGTELGLSKPLWVFNPGSLGDRPHSFGTLTVRRGQLLFGHGRLS